jgi:hypothetical protein
VSAETTLVDVLENAAAVTAIIGERIFPDVIPQGADLPAIAYYRTSTEYVQTIHGSAPVGATPGLSVACVAYTRPEADALADAALAALGAGGFSMLGRQAAVDLETDIWATVLDVTFNE